MNSMNWQVHFALTVGLSFSLLQDYSKSSNLLPYTT